MTPRHAPISHLPPSPPWAQLPALRWVHLEVTHELQADLPLPSPGHLGALLRSVLGLALHGLSPLTFELFMNDRSDTLRPWWLSPPDVGPETALPAGRVLRWRLSLHEQALPCLPDCVQALAQIGELGLGPQRTPARLLGVAVLSPGGTRPLAQVQQGLWSAQQVWQQTTAELAGLPGPASLWVQADTPLRIKRDNRVVMAPPALDVLLQAVMTRVNALLSLTEHPQSPPGPMSRWLAPRMQDDWLDWAAQVLPDLAWTQRQPVERWSARQQRAIRMDGLIGTWAYPSEASIALHWLRLGEHLQLGGKTTVGMGACRISMACTQISDTTTVPLLSETPLALTTP